MMKIIVAESKNRNIIFDQSNQITNLNQQQASKFLNKKELLVDALGMEVDEGRDNLR